MSFSKLLTTVVTICVLSGCASSGVTSGVLSGLSTAAASGMEPGLYSSMALNPANLAITAVTGAMDYQRQQKNRASFDKMMAPGNMENMVVQKFNQSNGTNFTTMEELSAYMQSLSKNQN